MCATGNDQRTTRLGRALALVTALGAGSAAAEFRCNTELVDRGMTPLEVLERCGAPELQLNWMDYRQPGLLVQYDEWTYHMGVNRFRRLLTFENGRLIRIETRDKPLSPALPGHF